MPRPQLVHVGDGLPYPEVWKRLMRGWRRLLGQFTDDGVELGYWYSERASVSALAGAAWRSWPTSLVIAEPGVHRGRPDERYRGRQDLWLSLPSFSVDLEAKQVWPAESPPGDATLRRVKRGLGEAQTQLRGMKQGMASRISDYQVAAVFVVPWMAERPDWGAADYRYHVNELASMMWQNLGSKAGGQTFQATFALNDEAFETYMPGGSRGDRFAPGVVLHGRLV